MKPKRKLARSGGHRQEITRLMINSISLNGSVLTSEEATASVAQQPVATPSDEPPVESTGEVATVVAASVDQQHSRFLMNQRQKSALLRNRLMNNNKVDTKEEIMAHKRHRQYSQRS